MHRRKLITLIVLALAALGFLAQGCDSESSSGDASADATTMDDMSTCRPAERLCDGVCTDTATDPANCGTCGTSCGSDEVCAAGTCESGCPAGSTECDRSCVDTNLDPAHCGACGTSCAATESCVVGICEDNGGCATGLTECAGTCVNLLDDGLHCGACDQACTATQSCTAGSCVEIGPIDPPTGECDSPLDLVDTTNPDTVVGDGTAASCTHDALATAVANAGIITFDCGPDPHLIEVTSALQLRIDADTVIDGGGLVTLDGGRDQGRTNRIFEYHSDNYRVTTTLVTLQRLTLQNAQAPASDYTPQDSANPECAWGYKDGEGGALRMRDGRLHVIDSVFLNNHAAPEGPDTGGGALYLLGALELVVSGSSFIGNTGSNGGAIGLLQTDGLFYNSTFDGNAATGTGQNFGGATGCPDFNHAEQGGAGGNSGAIGVDGNSVERFTFCGVVLRNNQANELGTVSRTPNSQRGLSTFDRVLFENNYAGDGGAALWMQDMTFEMRNSAVIGNRSDGLGAGVRISQGPHGSTILIENTTFQGNVAQSSLGGGLVFSGEGTVRNCTFAENEAAGGEGFFGAAVVAHGDESQGLQIHNSIFWNNIDDHEWTPMTCSVGSPGAPVPLPGDNNIQWPETRNGTNNQMDNLCTTGTVFADAILSPLADNGGFTPTMMPGADAVVVGIGQNCPATDQRGQPRPGNGCAAGAVEP